MLKKSTRDYAFLVEEGAAVGMQVSQSDQTNYRVSLAVAFCRQSSPANEEKPSDDYSKDAAKNILDTRLNSPETRYTVTFDYSGDKPKREVLSPFLRFVRRALAAGRSGQRRNVDRVFSNLKQWRSADFKVPGSGLAEAQQASICGSAYRYDLANGAMIWPSGSEVVYTGGSNNSGFAPASEKVSQRFADAKDWQPLTPKKLSKQELKAKRSVQEKSETPVAAGRYTIDQLD